MKKLKIAIVGATGLVGYKILEVLREEGFLRISTITLFVSEKSSGKMMFFDGECYRLLMLNEASASKHFDFVFFSAGEVVSQKFAPIFASFGAVVIDNTNAFRKTNPLIVPEINFERVAASDKIIANPNCSTIQLAIVLEKFQALSKIKEVVVSTYQSVSGAGKAALLDLENGTKKVFKKGITNNIIPQIGVVDEIGNSTEENKIMFELGKILNSDIRVVATAVRVPVLNCHGESVFVKFENPVNFEKLKQMPVGGSIELLESDVFVNADCAETNKVFVCRLRKISETEICFFVFADNLRRGAAFNAVKIAEKYIKKFNNFQNE